MRTGFLLAVQTVCFAGMTAGLSAGCKRASLNSEPIDLPLVTQVSPGLYRHETEGGAVEVSVEWKDSLWWLQLRRNGEVLIPATPVSEYDFPHGQYLEVGDLNRDSQPDFVFTDYGGGVGLMATYCHKVILLSRRGGYEVQILPTYERLDPDFLRGNDQPVLLISQLVNNGDDRYWIGIPMRLLDTRFEPWLEGLPGWPRAVPVDSEEITQELYEEAFAAMVQQAVEAARWPPSTAASGAGTLKTGKGNHPGDDR